MFIYLVLIFLCLFSSFSLIAHIPTPPCVHSPPSVLLISILPLDHERKIELSRYLVSGFVNVRVLDTFSERASVLASSTAATFRDGTDPVPPLLFLPVPSCQSERVPKPDG